MRRELFDAFCRLIRSHTGMAFTEHKQPFVEAKVRRRTLATGLADDGYLELLGRDEDELVLFIDSLLTNVTKFFRTPEHFEMLGGEVRRRVAAGQRRLRCWSAACATGEEAWSMALTIADALRGERCDWRVLATDLSSRALATAEAAVYEVEALGALARQRRHFEALPGDRSRVRVCAGLRRHVSFARLDLAHPPFPMRGPFDVIFCRNVLMYLGQAERRALVASLEELLAPGGRLAVSPAEGVRSLATRLTTIDHAQYLRR